MHISRGGIRRGEEEEEEEKEKEEKEEKDQGGGRSAYASLPRTMITSSSPSTFQKA